MAKLLDLLVAAEGFAPVAGRVYAQDGDGEVWWFRAGAPISFVEERDVWCWDGVVSDCDTEIDDGVPLADDHTTAFVTAEAILAARGAV